ncbi:glycosyltransferase family 87 protein [Kallotenue papyrolyticum]|uniref:glycosyltransferase family 87 protein n=1 Tax=Kallotenue papyrolyticum TaxID=1325125 RepID=UPI000478673A|nr:glycosyltransferase family 87 protein [Kallotenue papyrolyticum]
MSCSSTSTTTAPRSHSAGLLLSPRFLRPAAMAYLAAMAVVWGYLFWLWLGGAQGRDREGTVLGPDFPLLYTGGWIVGHGQAERLYDLQLQQALQRQLLNSDVLSTYVYPPHWSLVGVPLSRLSYAQAFALWTALMLSAVLLSLVLLRVPAPVLRGRDGWLIAGLALGAAPVYAALSAGQNSGLSLLLHSAMLVALVRRRDALAGLLLALGMYKPQLFVALLPLLLLERRWRCLGVWALGTGGLALISGLVHGFQSFDAWLALLRSPLFQGEEVRQAGKYFSWQPFWIHLLGHTPLATGLALSCMALTLLGLAWSWWRRRDDQALRYAVAICALLLIGPHTPVYDLTLLLIPGLIISDRLARQPAELRRPTQLTLLLLYVALLFSLTPELRSALVITPLIALLAWQAARLPSTPAAAPAATAPARPMDPGQARAPML